MNFVDIALWLLIAAQAAFAGLVACVLIAALLRRWHSRTKV